MEAGRVARGLIDERDRLVHLAGLRDVPPRHLLKDRRDLIADLPQGGGELGRGRVTGEGVHHGGIRGIGDTGGGQVGHQALAQPVPLLRRPHGHQAVDQLARGVSPREDDRL